MARLTKKPVQQYGGTTAQHATYTGAAREITIDTTKNTVVVQDGITAGGHPLAKEARKIIGDDIVRVNDGLQATLAQDINLSVTLSQMLSADANNGLQEGSDGKLYAGATQASLLIRPTDLILYDAEGKMAADLGMAYNAATGKLDILGRDKTSVVASVVVPTSTSALRAVDVVDGKPDAAGEAIEGDYLVSVRGVTADGYTAAKGLIFHTTNGTGASQAVAFTETLTGYEVVFNGEKQVSTMPTGQVTFADGSTFTLMTDSAQFIPAIGMTPGRFMVFTFELASGEVRPLYVDLTDLIDVYTAGNGLTVANNQFSIKLSANSGFAFDENGGLKVDLVGSGDPDDPNSLVNQIVSGDAGNALSKGTDGKLKVDAVSKDASVTDNMLTIGSDGGAVLHESTVDEKIREVVATDMITDKTLCAALRSTDENNAIACQDGKMFMPCDYGTMDDE